MKRIYLLPALLLLGYPSVSHAQPTILAEVFGNFGCANCKNADLAFDDYLFDKPTIQLINYHNEFPTPSDAFFAVARQGQQYLYRSTLYAVNGDPVEVTNGGAIERANSELTWEDNCNSATHLPPLTVTAYKTADGMIYIHAKNTLTLPAAVRLNVALLESNIVQANPGAQGIPPSNVWDNIFREMLPTPDGFLFTPTGADEFTYSFDPTQTDANGDTWNPDNMKAVAFLQDDQGATKKVESLGVVSLANLPLSAVTASDHKTTGLRILGNPTKGTSQFWLTLPSSSHVKLTLSDMLGREVRVLVDVQMPEGQTSVEMNTGTLPAGCYIARMFIGGSEVDHAKLVVE